MRKARGGRISPYSIRVLAVLVGLYNHGLAQCSYSTVNLTAVGNFGHVATTLTIDGKDISMVLVDTGSSDLALLECTSSTNSTSCVRVNSSSPSTTSSTGLYLEVDLDIANYTCAVQSFGNKCFKIQTPGSFLSSPPSASSVEVLAVDEISVQNSVLHPWQDTKGILGLGYDYASEQNTISQTSFEKMLVASAPQCSKVFGLDMREANQSSSLHLGGIPDNFADSLLWAEFQARELPTYHTAFLFDLRLCGVNVFGNWSNTWEVIISSADTCLTLPLEMVETVMSWIPANSTSPNGDQIVGLTGHKMYVIPYDVPLSELPAFVFSLSFEGEPLYLPLSELLLPESVLASQFRGLGTPLCILTGDSVQYVKGDLGTELSQIVFGARVLQALYLAADMANPRVGFANKGSNARLQTLVNASTCLPPAVCKGRQRFDSSRNQCLPPQCEQYYFMELDSDLMVCSFKDTAVRTGVAFVVVLVVLEIFAYLVMEYSFCEVTQAPMDLVTRSFGKMSSLLLDRLVRKLSHSAIQRWQRRPA